MIIIFHTKYDKNFVTMSVLNILNDTIMCLYLRKILKYKHYMILFCTFVLENSYEK